MIQENNMPDKPTIEYPTQWGFKLIGRDKEAILECIKEAMGAKKHTCKLGNSSRTGKFHTYNAHCVVESEEERNRIFKYCQEHDAVEMIL